MGDVSSGGVAKASLGGSNFTRTALLVTGVALLSVAAYFVLKTAVSAAAGDEPPIRVKGGSIHFELLKGSASWEPQGNPSVPPDPKKWQIAGAVRGGDDLSIYFAPVDPARCRNVTHKKDKKIKFIYRDSGTDHEIELKVGNNKTKVDSRTLDLVSAAAARTELKYARAGETPANRGFIKQIWVGNETQPTCTFTAPDQLHSVLILEP